MTFVLIEHYNNFNHFAYIQFISFIGKTGWCTGSRHFWLVKSVGFDYLGDFKKIFPLKVNTTCLSCIG